MRKASQPEKPLLALIATSEATEPHFTAPLATTCEHDESVQLALQAAIATVKAAGYRVSKPRRKHHKDPVKDRVGPTFIAEFSDGTVTRMSVFTSLEKLDWERGERLSIAAYQARWRREHFKQAGRYPTDAVAPVPPAIIAARFEQDGKVLAQRDSESVS
jgi:hypothetical protein